MLATFSEALALVLTGDAKLYGIIALSLQVSVAAVLLATLAGGALGAVLAVTRFPGRKVLIVLLNAALGLPPVVVGLAVYLLLSRAGPLGPLGILFTPQAMVMAQWILITPLIAALTRQIVEDAWREYHDLLQLDGVAWWHAGAMLLWGTRYSLVTVVLAGLGRALSEVGALMIVGGNIDGVTRVMTTAIALETSKGDLGLAMALGVILLALVLALNVLTFVVREWAQKRYG